jgi:hypothetical protein
VAVLVLAFACTAAHAQSDFLDKDQKGMGVDLGLSMSVAGTASLSLGADYSVNGFVDLGIDVAVASGGPLSAALDCYEAAMAWKVTVLKQDRIVPFTISLPGSLRKRLYTRTEQADGSLIKTGTGYSLGLDVFRYVPVAYHRYARFGLTALLESWMCLTESTGSEKLAGYPLAEASLTAGFGGIAGLSFRPSAANRGTAGSVDLRILINSDKEVTVASVVSLTIVENKTERMYQ